jgi:hypothetical protein
MNLTVVMPGKKQYAVAFMLRKLENPVISMGERHSPWGIAKIVSA